MNWKYRSRGGVDGLRLILGLSQFNWIWLELQVELSLATRTPQGLERKDSVNQYIKTLWRMTIPFKSNNLKPKSCKRWKNENQWKKHRTGGFEIQSIQKKYPHQSFWASPMHSMFYHLKVQFCENISERNDNNTQLFSKDISTCMKWWNPTRQ